MNPNDYQNESMRTMPENYPALNNMDESQKQCLHAALGISSESGEVSDELKKHLIYGRPLDKLNIKEECGDLLWYIALALKYCGYTMEEAMEMNVAKLRLRYPEKFTEHHAAARLDKCKQ